MQSCLYIYAGGFFPSSVQVRDHPFERVAVFFFVRRRRTVKQYLSDPDAQFTERRFLAYFEIPAESLYQPVVIDVHPLAAFAPRIYRAVLKRNGLVRGDEVGVELKNCPEPVAAFAGAVRTVKAEQSGRKFFQRSLRMFSAGKFLAVDDIFPIAVAPVFVRFLDHYRYQAFPDLQGRLYRIS